MGLIISKILKSLNGGEKVVIFFIALESTNRVRLVHIGYEASPQFARAMGPGVSRAPFLEFGEILIK